MGQAARVASKGIAAYCGFTLIELMMAVLLLVSAVTACTFALSRGILATKDVEARQQAVFLATEKLEELRGTDFGQIRFGSTTEEILLDRDKFFRQVDVTPQGDGDLKQVVVTVSWESAGDENSTSLTTYLVKIENP
jgi:prepilin-type N-terminal cleavage/methylation domain-containing protein